MAAESSSVPASKPIDGHSIATLVIFLLVSAYDVACNGYRSRWATLHRTYLLLPYPRRIDPYVISIPKGFQPR